MGGYIVAQTFVNLLLADKASYLWQHRHWRPELPASQPGTFTVTDLIKFTLGNAAPVLQAEDVTLLPDVDNVPELDDLPADPDLPPLPIIPPANGPAPPQPIP